MRFFLPLVAGLSASSLVDAVPTSNYKASRPELSRRQATTASLPFPVTDPFYVVPDDIDNYENGAIIRQRDVEPKPNIGVPFDKTVQVFYKTTDAEGNADGTVATIWVPAAPATPAKLFSYQLAEDSLNINCAPSFAWVNSSSTNEYVADIEGPVVVPNALNNGWYVVAPDFEGSKSSFIAGNTEGRAVLDGIRAATTFASLDTPRTALYGYSGGSHASSWAATLSLSYAPELNIVALANGGVPVDPVSSLDHINLTPNAVLAFAGIFGLGNAYSVLNDTFESELTPFGLNASVTLRAPENCLVQGPVSDEYAGKDAYLAFNTGREILDRPQVIAVLERESLLNGNRNCDPAPVFKFPAFYYHGLADNTVPYDQDKEYVDQQCAAGANIRFASYPGASHEAAFLLGLQPALTFIGQALDGVAPKYQCGTDNLIA